MLGNPENTEKHFKNYMLSCQPLSLVHFLPDFYTFHGIIPNAVHCDVLVFVRIKGNLAAPRQGASEGGLTPPRATATYPEVQFSAAPR